MTIEPTDLGLLTPSDFGLHHDKFYEHQLETILWALEQKNTMLVEAPTGSGKTSLGRSLTQKKNGVALVKTKFLQSVNYAAGYDFIPLYGRDNYACSYYKAEKGATAADCAFTLEGMTNCPQYNDCGYAAARTAAKFSRRSVLNYAYWLHVHKTWNLSGYLVCDEGHELPDIVLEWAGVTVTEEKRIDFDIPMFPMIRSNGGIRGADPLDVKSDVKTAEERAIGWLNNSTALLAVQIARTQERAKYDEKQRKRLRSLEFFYAKLVATRDALQVSPNDWFIRSGPGADEGKKAFICRPLTARHHFKYYFRNPNWQTLIMSATIGDEKVFAQELGLNDFSFLRVPSRYTAVQKPVHCLDVPRLGQKSKEEDWNKQADEIAKGIKGCDPKWNGLIHTTSYTQTDTLAHRLARRGLQDRIWAAPKGTRTDKTIELWHERMQKRPGSLFVTPILHSGYDGTLEKINILAKTPYPAMSSEFDKARQMHDGAMYLQRAAWVTMQICGRVRRNPEDYDTPDKRNTYNAMADGGWNYVKKYFSPDFMSSLVKEK